MKLKDRLKGFFAPPAGSPRWMRILPYAILGVVVILILVGGTYGWDYTNSPKFCGYTCHTMPPQNATYITSPHANVYCTECHIGRAFVGQQFARKSEDLREIYATVFNTYEYPIRATRSRPARETCEKCHQPETFTDDKLKAITHFKDTPENTPYTIYLVLKTGGGAKQQGLGRGIHWHIVNKVQYYATDQGDQAIPYIRVYNDDGTITEYVDVASGTDPKQIKASQLKTMDCITCHNRVTHNFQFPSESVDSAMARGLIDPAIPNIHQQAVQVLSAQYASHKEAVAAIQALGDSYKSTEFYAGHEKQIADAVQAIQTIYDRTVFTDQKVDWTTHPNNVGHINSPGCFRCHDGKHLDANQQAIRLECNLCHAIPVVANQQDFLTRIEISRGPEPKLHLSPNWISLHNQAFDATCANCHNTQDAGGTSNTSFCSNSACHGGVYKYAGFDAPALRLILAEQLPTPTPIPTPTPTAGAPTPTAGAAIPATVAPADGALTFEANIAPIFTTKCTMCHSATSSAPAGLNLTTYADTMKGSQNGAVIIPGKSADSRIVQVQSVQHFVNLTPDELALLKKWIDAGALEK